MCKFDMFDAVRQAQSIVGEDTTVSVSCRNNLWEIRVEWFLTGGGRHTVMLAVHQADLIECNFNIMNAKWEHLLRQIRHAR